jgi:hypothetical protein
MNETEMVQTKPIANYIYDQRTINKYANCLVLDH